ncbi:hypothetical protein BGX27_010862 [Mortierella sp. AM989]|nr:hypothetical protein BGX27_010862 [Mortierella sp. AM989]
MTTEDFFPQTSQRKTIDIGDGLIMRWSTKKDTENVANLVMDAFRWLPFGDPHPQDRIPGPNELTGAAVRRLLSGKSASMGEFDYALVEDTKRAEGKNPIVACISLQRHEIYYGSTLLTAGEPELIATDTEYRNRGLIRRLLFEMVHPESEARGDAFQYIPGIQHFYRQFGYEYGLCCHTAASIDSPDVIPPLGKDKSESYILRQASLDDLDFLCQLSTPERLHSNTSIATVYTRRYWQYTVHDAIEDRQHRFDADRETCVIIEAKSGKAVGFTVVSYCMFGPQLEAFALDEELATHVDVKDSVLRQLFANAKKRNELSAKEYEEAMKKNAGNKATVDSDASTTDAVAAPAGPSKAEPEPFKYSINLQERHPLCILLGNKAKRNPNALGFRLYTRISSYPAFIKAVAPELEKRLANSALAGVSGTLRLNFFRKVEGSSGKGLEIFFEKGRIVDAHDWVKGSPEEELEEKQSWKKKGNTPVLFCASFAPLTFTNLVTGKDSLQELIWAYGENRVQDDATRTLLDTLFPKSEHRFDVFTW